MNKIYIREISQNNYFLFDDPTTETGKFCPFIPATVMPGNFLQLTPCQSSCVMFEKRAKLNFKATPGREFKICLLCRGAEFTAELLPPFQAPEQTPIKKHPASLK